MCLCKTFYPNAPSPVSAQMELLHGIFLIMKILKLNMSRSFSQGQHCAHKPNRLIKNQGKKLKIMEDCCSLWVTEPQCTATKHCTTFSSPLRHSLWSTHMLLPTELSKLYLDIISSVIRSHQLCTFHLDKLEVQLTCYGEENVTK